MGLMDAPWAAIVAGSSACATCSPGSYSSSPGQTLFRSEQIGRMVPFRAQVHSLCLYASADVNQLDPSIPHAAFFISTNQQFLQVPPTAPPALLVHTVAPLVRAFSAQRCIVFLVRP